MNLQYGRSANGRHYWRRACGHTSVALGWSRRARHSPVTRQLSLPHCPPRRLVTAAALIAFFCATPQHPATAESGGPPSAVSATLPLTAPDNFGRDTPRRTLRRFLKECLAHDYQRAAIYLNLHRLPEETRCQDGPVLAHHLSTILHTMWIDPELLSDAPEGDAEDGLPPGHDRVGVLYPAASRAEILLDRVPNEHGVLVWEIASETVAVIPELYTEFGHSPLGDVLPSALVRLLRFSWLAVIMLTIAILEWLAVPRLKQGVRLFQRVRLFVSYRREDPCAQAQAARLQADLERCLPRSDVNMDIKSFEPGAQFPDAIKDIASCDFLIVVIGTEWLTLLAKHQAHPADEDWVKVEIETAIRNKVPIFPVLVNGAEMPKDLPKELRQLAKQHGLEVTIERWSDDVKRLVKAIKKASFQLRRRLLIAAVHVAAILLVAGVVAAVAYYVESPPPLKVAVMTFQAPQPKDSSFARANLHQALYALGKPKLQVEPVEICENMNESDCLKSRGIHKGIAGELSTSQSTVSMVVRIDRPDADLRTEHKFKGEADKKDLVKLQMLAAVDLLAWFHIEATPEKVRLLVQYIKESPGMAETHEDFIGTFPEIPEQAPMAPHAASPETSVSFAWGIAIADAQVLSEEAAIRELLQEYGKALQDQQVERCAELQVEMTARQRDSLQRYFANAENLQVQISNVDIAIEGDEALATFTRTDKFTEKPTGRDVQLEVRVSTLLAKRNGRWKIRGLKKPS